MFAPIDFTRAFDAMIIIGKRRNANRPKMSADDDASRVRAGKRGFASKITYSGLQEG